MSEYESNDYNEEVCKPHSDFSDIELELLYDEESGDSTLLDPNIEDNYTHWITVENKESVYDLENWF